MRAKRRDVCACEAERAALAVPVLVEIEDALHDGSEKRIWRAMSAPCWQRVSTSSRDDLAAVDGDVDDGAEAFGEAGLHAGVVEDEAEDIGEAGVDELEVAFDADVVGEIELADARGVGRAADVLEQQRVVEVGELRRRSCPIARPMFMPIQQQRMPWPAGWPSVMSSA